MSDEDWADLAEAWLEELSAEPTAASGNTSQAVVLMNFTSSAEQQWKFIVTAVAKSKTDEHLGHIAAGPMEHLLGTSGDEFIALVEELSSADVKFARMVTGVWKYQMSDEVWERVEAIKATVDDPL